MASQSCVVVVDPLSTGGVLAAELVQRGYAVIAAYSKDLGPEMRHHVPVAARGLKYHAEIEEQSTLQSTVAAITAAVTDKLHLQACIVGAETGVPLADALSQALGLRTNGTQVNRRDKSVQQKCVKAAGLRAVREAVGKEWSEVEAFAASESMPVVVKPVESAGSEGVKLCKTKAEAEEHFKLLMGAQLHVGSAGAAVLVQEYLRGKEYVVDHVSQDGVHKTVMIWVYDKRACNGADFVYYGMVPVAAESELAKVLITYTRGVLDALGIKNGPTHGEVMMTPYGPCLVEMNCRSHGGEGSWVPLARSLTGGYSQVDAAIDSFLDESAFARLPERPRPFQASGQEVMLVSMQAGRVLATPGFDKIRQLKSFESLATDVTVGSTVELSIDLFTSLGSVFLMHEDPDVMAADLRAIRAMELECTLFELSEDSESDTSSHSGSSSPGRVEDSCAAGVLPALNLLVKWVNNKFGADALPPTPESRA
jgi:biotin carboxylase